MECINCENLGQKAYKTYQCNLSIGKDVIRNETVLDREAPEWCPLPETELEEKVV